MFVRIAYAGTILFWSLAVLAFAFRLGILLLTGRVVRLSNGPYVPPRARANPWWLAAQAVMLAWLGALMVVAHTWVEFQ